MIVGGMGLSGDKMFKGGVKVWDIHIPGPEPREGVAEAERRARAMPVLGKQYRRLEVVSYGDAQELHLCVAHGSDPKAMEWLQWVPLASIQSLELGTADEWFGSLSEAELRRMGSAPNSWVIVAPTLGHGVLRIAESAGSKAGITALHGLLTKRFVVDAPEMLARWKEKLEEEMLEKEMLAREESEKGEPPGQHAREGEGVAPSAIGAGEGGDAVGAHDREK